MTRTVVESKTKTVIIGFDQPFCVIGERINPTGRTRLAAEMVAGDFTTVESDALAQAAAGATMLDVNAGVTAVDPNETEPALLAKTVELVQSLVDLPLSIDSSVPAALEAGLAVAKGRPLVNSVTGEEDRLERILPLIKKHDVPVVAISNDESGISEDPDVRFAVAKKIVERAADYGIKAEDIVVDPLVMPIGAMNTAGRQVFQLVRRLREELKVNTTCGASNISFGIPNRRVMNAHFLSMAAAVGITSAIMNPLHKEDMDAIRSANTLNGHDPDCRQWLTANRPAGAEGEAGGRRRGGRRRSAAGAAAE
jgi:5-methyltetrahydrofolate--homocysteine methyltransferase